MAETPALREVARSVGVSTSTVSRVVNDRPGVHEGTRRKIRTAVKRLGYLPHPGAADLKTGRGRLVHVIAESEDAPLTPPILAGFATAAHEGGYRVLLSTLDYERRSVHVDQRVVAGVIVVPAFEHAVDLDWLTRDVRVPVVCVYGYASDPDHVNVVSDDRGGAIMATAHLASRGCRHIAYIGGIPDWIQSKQRIAGYEAALAEHDLKIDEALVEQGDWSRESGYAACQLLLSRGQPDGIFSANDKMASGVIHCLTDHGLRIPEDVALVGFDDRDLCQFVTPRLTSIALPLREMGEMAFQVLLRNIAGPGDGNEPVTGTIEVACRLVERDST